MSPAVSQLRELYIEPTSHCNLHCVMCSRNSWKNEHAGHMALTLFDKIIDEIPDSINRIFFGGIGEPLFHPDIMYMLRRAKETGCAVEMITNGTLLDLDMSEKIVDARLDILWISFGSMGEDSYEHTHLCTGNTSVMSNINTFNKVRGYLYRNLHYTLKTKLGISFILMKRNLSEYKRLLQNAYSLGIAKIKATHLIPYEKSQLGQICYERVFGAGLYGAAGNLDVHVDMPFMDTQDIQKQDMLQLFSYPVLSFSFMGMPLQTKVDYCRFIQEGVAFVRWDGEVCPCMALLHENTVYQQNTERYIRPCSFGNINGQNLLKIWEKEPYVLFRQKVMNFVFSPCTSCGPCDMFETNEEDCMGNKFPVCGACLWAKGLFQCP